MTIIAEKDRETIRDLLARELVQDVELLLFTRPRSSPAVPGHQDCETCDETRELLEDLVGLSDRLQLTTHDVGTDPAAATRYNVSAVPTVLVRRAASGGGAETGAAEAAPRPAAHETPCAAAAERAANVRFLGLPAGYEFSTLLADVVDVSRGRTDLSVEARAAVRAIDRPVHIQVFVTPACPYCPRAARVAHQMAMENPLIVADVIEANEFQELSERYRVMSVPKTVIDDRIAFVGSLPEPKVVEALMRAVNTDA